MLLADTPTTWPDPEPMSTLEALLIFVGGPALLIAVITLLVMAPSLAKGPRYRPGQAWWAEPEWFGGPEGGLKALDTSGDRRAITASAVGAAGPGHADVATEQSQTGGASVNW